MIPLVGKDFNEVTEMNEWYDFSNYEVPEPKPKPIKYDTTNPSPQMKRCANCACLYEDEYGRWMCGGFEYEDDEHEIHDIVFCAIEEESNDAKE